MSQRERIGGDLASSAESNEPEPAQGATRAALSPVRRNTAPGYVPTIPYQDTDNATGSNNGSARDKERLDGESDHNHVQFATYPEGEKPINSIGHPLTPNAGQESKSYVPLPLRPYLWIPLVAFLVAAAIALEVALHFSDKRQGWESGPKALSSVALHYAYTLPPVIIAAVIVALWTWTDMEIMKMQPYVDLVHGDSPPHRSLLLDYTRDNKFIVWTHAASNQHYVVAVASLMALVCLSFQPLAAALLEVKNTWIQLPDVTMSNLAQIGLNQNSQFSDLTSFLAGAGYAGASITFDLPSPPFIHVPYTVAPFQLPTSLTTNGTASVNTTALKTSTGCQSVPVQMTQLPQNAWQNEITMNGCSFSFEVTNISEILFGVDIPQCTTSTPEEFSPVVFWFFAYVPTVIASATFCSPSFSLWEVEVDVNTNSGNITAITETRPFTSASNFSSASVNVTGAPLNGRAYNGITFNLTNPDQFVLARQNATRLQLPASVYQAALQTPQGAVGNFRNISYSTLVDQVYSVYLALVAKEVYFLSDNEPITVQVKTFQERVWLSHPSVHLLAIGFLILAFFGTLVHLVHRADRRFLRLTHLPGTIASAVSLGAQTGVGDVLAGRHAEEDLRSALADKRFRMNPDTMRIIMDTEEEYEVPDADGGSQQGPVRRMSVIGMLQGRRMSRRFSVGNKLPTINPGTPTTSRSPQTPHIPATPPKSPHSSADAA